MRIKEVRIEKFRSIQKCSIWLKDLNAIVGENNSGKTAILRAINAFFHFEEEEEYFNNNTHRFSPKANTKIELVFDEIIDRDFYKDKLDNQQLIVGIKYTYSSGKRSIYYKTNGTEIACDDSLINEIRNDIDYLYIPASRGNYDLIWSRESIFNKLILEFARKYTESRDMVSKHVLSATKKLHSSIFDKIERQLGDLFPANENYKFSINYNTDADYKLLLDNLVLNMQEKDNTYPIQEYGSGIKSLAIISIFRMLATMTNRSVILGIEEPETNLHPQMQKQFISSIQDGKRENEVQLIMATHSTVIIDTLKHDEIMLVRRVYNEKNGFISVISQLKENFWEQAGIEEFKHYQFFNYRNSDFFFSKYIIVTESKTDAQVIDKLISKELGWKKAYISIINLEGVTNLAYPYYLLKELKIPFSVIVDKDFFTGYIENELKNSRNTETGLPIYKEVLNDTDLIKNIFNTKAERDRLIQVLNSNVYTRVFSFLKKYKFYTMQYCLEMDMTCSNSICDEYYKYLNMLPNEQSQKNLLLKKHKAIKGIDYILNALDNVKPQVYPNSLKKIKNGILDDVLEYVK